MFFSKRPKIFNIFEKAQQKNLGKCYSKGDVIIREGEIDRKMYVILSGKLEIFRTEVNQKDIRLVVLGKGETVGEMAMFDGAPRSASVRVLEDDTWLLAMDRRTLMKRIHEDPFLMLSILHRVSDRLRRTTEDLVHYITLFNELNKEHLAATRSLGTLAQVCKEPGVGERFRNKENLVTRIALQLKEWKRHPEIITEEFITDLGLASNLHDVGIKSLPNEILEKKERLTAEEWKTIKRHVNASVSVIKKAAEQIEGESFLPLAAEIAKYHHEHYDGTGYLGLKWDKIPLSARIVSVVDAYNALISQRPYREKLSQQAALEVIQQEAGAHFDPEVVKAFLAVMAAYDPKSVLSL